MKPIEQTEASTLPVFAKTTGKSESQIPTARDKTTEKQSSFSDEIELAESTQKTSQAERAAPSVSVLQKNAESWGVVEVFQRRSELPPDLADAKEAVSIENSQLAIVDGDSENIDPRSSMKTEAVEDTVLADKIDTRIEELQKATLVEDGEVTPLRGAIPEDSDQSIFETRLPREIPAERAEKDVISQGLAQSSNDKVPPLSSTIAPILSSRDVDVGKNQPVEFTDETSLSNSSVILKPETSIAIPNAAIVAGDKRLQDKAGSQTLQPSLDPAEIDPMSDQVADFTEPKFPTVQLAANAAQSTAPPSPTLATIGVAENLIPEPNYDEAELARSLELASVKEKGLSQAALPLNLQQLNGAAARQIVGQVSAGLSQLNDGGIEIRLNPVELGRITIQIMEGSGGQSANVLVEKPEVLDLLKRNENLLQSEFSDAGFAFASFNFDQQDTPEGEEDPEFASEASTHSSNPHPTFVSPVMAGATADLDIRL